MPVDPMVNGPSPTPGTAELRLRGGVRGEPSAEPCRVLVGGKECGEGWASHANGTIYVHDFAADGIERPHPNLRLIEVGSLADAFATGF